MRDYMEIFMKVFKFFGPIQLLCVLSGWVAVLLGLILVVDAGNAVQKPLTKKCCHHAGLNCGPCACEAHVITTTPWWHCGSLVVSVQLRIVKHVCSWCQSRQFKRFARKNSGPYYLHYPWLPGRSSEGFTFYWTNRITFLSFWFIFVVVRL